MYNQPPPPSTYVPPSQPPAQQFQGYPNRYEGNTTNSPPTEAIYYNNNNNNNNNNQNTPNTYGNTAGYGNYQNSNYNNCGNSGTSNYNSNFNHSTSYSNASSPSHYNNNDSIGNYNTSQSDYNNNTLQETPLAETRSPPVTPGRKSKKSSIRAIHVQLTKFSDHSKFFDHPSIPRIFPSDIENDVSTLPWAPNHVRPVSRLSVRPTFGVIPKTHKDKNLEAQIGLPVGIVLRPFAEDNVPLVDFVQHGNKIVRCRRCTGYINPFNMFSDAGRRWSCCLCKHVNETSKPYFCPLDASTGLRTDINERPELQYASMDIVATPEFLKRPPIRPVIVFMLDLSYSAVSSGLLSSICQGVLLALENLKDNDAIHISIIGFDNTVYLFNFVDESSPLPRVMVVPDVVNELCNINDNFRLDPIELPCTLSECVVPVKYNYEKLCFLFENLPTMFGATKEVGCAFGGAISAAATLLSRTGGKIISSICSIPSFGEGRLKHRFDLSSMSGKPNEYTMCSVGNDWYKQRALACASSNISFDLIAGGTEDMDLATIAPLCRYTSGSVIRATVSNMGGIAEQVQRMITRCFAFDSVLRVRPNNGAVITNFFGHCHVREPDLLTLPIGTEDLTYSIEFKLNPEYKSSYVYVQFAIVYTTKTQERRIRVHTVQLRASDNVNEVINSIDSLGVASFLCKMGIDYSFNGPFEQAQDKVSASLVTALRFVQNECIAKGDIPGAGQLIIPESMRYIPQIIHGFFRMAAISLRKNTPITPDDRVASMSTVLTCSPEALVTNSVMWCYVVYSPHHSIEELPTSMHTSLSLFRQDAIYFINLGTSLVLWYGSNVNPEVLLTFGIQASSVPDGRHPISPQDLDGLRERTENLIWEHKSLCSPAFCANLEFVPAGTGVYEFLMSKAMLEDDYAPKIPSYSNYLLTLWQQVNQKKAK